MVLTILVSFLLEPITVIWCSGEYDNPPTHWKPRKLEKIHPGCITYSNGLENVVQSLHPDTKAAPKVPKAPTLSRGIRRSSEPCLRKTLPRANQIQVISIIKILACEKINTNYRQHGQIITAISFQVPTAWDRHTNTAMVKEPAQIQNLK